MIHYQNVRDPIEYVVDDYFRRKQMILIQANGGGSASLNAILRSGSMPDDNLPEIPMQVIRNDGVVTKVIHGNVDALLNDPEADPIIWQEEFIRDKDKKVIQIKITYPDGSDVTNDINRTDGLIEGIK